MRDPSPEPQQKLGANAARDSPSPPPHESAKKEHRAGEFVYFSPPLIASQSLPELPDKRKSPKRRSQLANAYGGQPPQQGKRDLGGPSSSNISPPGGRARIGMPHRVPDLPVLPPLPTLPPPPEERSLSEQAQAFKSPLITLEMQLKQQLSGEERAPTLSRAAACFGALRGLLASVAPAFRPLLTILHRELWASVYDSRRGGVAHFDDTHRLRHLLGEKDAEIQMLRDEHARREAEIASLKAALIEVDVQTMEEIPMTAEAILAIPVGPHMAKAIRENPLEEVDSAEAEAEAEAAKGNALAGLVSQASGRNVFDRVEQGASNFKKKAAKAAAEEAKAELAELAAGGANVPSADDAAGNMPLRPDADPEIKKLRKQLRHSVSRTNYDQIVAR